MREMYQFVLVGEAHEGHRCLKCTNLYYLGRPRVQKCENPNEKWTQKVPPHKSSSGNLLFCVQIASIL